MDASTRQKKANCQSDAKELERAAQTFLSVEAVSQQVDQQLASFRSLERCCIVSGQQRRAFACVGVDEKGYFELGEYTRGIAWDIGVGEDNRPRRTGFAMATVCTDCQVLAHPAAAPLGFQ
eukprot:6202106-Pleurochrysis_carterae.AAC.1